MKKKNLAQAMLVLLISVLFSGCAITSPVSQTRNDAIRVACLTDITGVAADTRICAIDMQQIDPTSGENAGSWTREKMVINTPSLAGEVVKGVFNGAGAAYIQGEAIKEVAGDGRCLDGSNCGTVNNINAVSGAASNAASDVGIAVDLDSFAQE